jgi:hypothetical protein
MNHTNRALNRFFLAATGLVLLAAGTLTAGAGMDAGVRDRWSSVSTSLLGGWRNLRDTAPLREPLGSWWALAVPAVQLLGAAVSIMWLTRQGGGRTSEAARQRDAELGDTAVDISYLESAVEAALEGNRAVVGSSVSAWRGRGRRRTTTQGLRITLQARRGASPREVADLAEALVTGMEALLAHRTTVLVRIAGGTRNRLAGAHRTT